MPKGVFKRTEKHRLNSILNGKKQLGKEPVNAKVKVNIQFDDYVVEERLTQPGSVSRVSLWRCKCTKCGEMHELTNRQLLSGYKTRCTKSFRSHNWTGHELITGSLWTRIKKQAVARELDFTLTIEQAWEMFENQKRRCALSGLNISFGSGKSGHTASLDRIDSTKGYVLDNVQWVHKEINMMKRNLPEAHFLNLCKLVSDHKK